MTNKNTKKTKESIKTLFQSLNSLESERKELEGKAKSLKKKEDSIKLELSSLIPKNKTKDSIFHKYYTKSSISYSKVYEKLVKDLVPKTKYPLAEQIKQSFTKETEYHTFTLEE